MSKYKTETSKETIVEAEKLAKANQRPGQSKEQTKIIALGIQKGIDQYKKKNKVKARELSKKMKTVQSKETRLNHQTDTNELTTPPLATKSNAIPWVLLLLSWGFFTVFYFL